MLGNETCGDFASPQEAARAADEKIDATLAAMIEVYKAAKAQGFGLCSRVIGELVEGLQEESGERRTKAEYQLGKAGASAEGLM